MIDKEHCGLIYVISCAVNNVYPSEQILGQYSLDALFTISKNHSISALVGYALQHNNAYKQSGSLFVEWELSQNKILRKTILMDEERKRILQYMDSNDIWYVPLKGIVLKDYYPAYGLREIISSSETLCTFTTSYFSVASFTFATSSILEIIELPPSE